MMRSFLLITILTIWSCHAQPSKLNEEVVQPGSKPYLLGKIDQSGLKSPNYSDWFVTGFENYQPNATVVKKIAEKLKGYELLVFMGTWCGDSRREIPKFFKVLNAANFPEKQLTTVAVSSKPNLYKQSPDHEERGLNIHRVPTFIFYKDGVEVNRIVEHPVKTLEEDILSILDGSYTSNYDLVNKINATIDDPKFYENALQNLEMYKQIATNLYELNTYSRILETTNRKDKALQVLELNTHLFSDQPATYMSLANFQLKSGQKNEALHSYKKAYELNPKNQKLKNRIDKLKSELSIDNN